ncbi:MAG: hypothetical protein JO246_00550 [Frankiaceae bacterium]|nr:hypothetical protein [Frankiaceae bacterium]MBV9869604.1 hypothetical protein [Frankiaceae bacterium]
MLLTQAEVTSASKQQVIIHLFTGGTSVTDQPTLDECGATYPSESKRDARIQVGYVTVDATGQQTQSASNEVVRYELGGTDQAYRELATAIRTCPPRVPLGKGTVVSHLRVLPVDPQLVTRQRTVVAQITSKGQPIWFAATFLFDGDLFDGVYTYDASKSVAIRVDRALARTANQRLRAALASEGTAT